VHHIVIDGWSVGVLSRELSHAYAAITAGGAPSLPRPAADYGDFVAWQRAYVAGPDCARDLEWWRGYLTGAAAVPALGGEPGRDGEPFRVGWLNLELPPVTAAMVRDLLRARGITLYMAVLAAQAILLSAETGSQDALVVTPHSLRVRAGWENLVGWFVNRVVVRPRVSPAAAFGELLEAVRENCIGVFAHGRVPFDLLREELALPSGTLSAQLSVQNAPVSGVVISGARVTHISDDSGRDFAPLLEVYSPAGDWFRFSVMLRERYDGRIAGGLEYDAARVTEPTARRWRAAFLAVLAAGAADPGTAVRQLRSLVNDPNRVRDLRSGGHG
jgi:non-ribosomal peptide synthetase component F